MKIVTRTLPLLGLILMVLNGCNREGDIKSGVSKLKEAFPSASAAAPDTPGNTDDSTSSKAVDPNLLVSRAVTALRNNDQVGAVMLLNTAKQQTGLTAQQRMAVQETIGTVYGDLAARAARGDAKAKAAITQMEKSYSQ